MYKSEQHLFLGFEIKSFDVLAGNHSFVWEYIGDG